MNECGATDSIDMQRFRKSQLLEDVDSWLKQKLVNLRDDQPTSPASPAGSETVTPQHFDQWNASQICAALDSVQGSRLSNASFTQVCYTLATLPVLRSIPVGAVGFDPNHG